MDPGAYQLNARKAGYQAKTQTVNVAGDSAQSDLAMDRGTGLSIRANDGLTGLPLRGVSVVAYAGGGGVAFSGSVSLFDGQGDHSLAPGVYSFYIFSNGYSPRSFPSVQVPTATLPVALTPGGRVEVRPAVQVSGRIVDASGAAYLVNPYRLDGRVNPAPPVTVWDNFTGLVPALRPGTDGERPTRSPSPKDGRRPWTSGNAVNVILRSEATKNLWRASLEGTNADPSLRSG